MRREAEISILKIELSLPDRLSATGIAAGT
eukprot:SAG31_NODE_42313_length_272_cov_0.601156_1_plen_29_part_01